VGGGRRRLVALGMLLDLVYPPRCAGCGTRGAWLCDACLERIQPLSVQRCARCRRPLAEAVGGAVTGRCADCASMLGDGLAGVLIVARYEDPLRSAIHALKYRGQRGLAQPLGGVLAKRAEALASHVDVVVPVPLHPSRERQRRYNQAALLAATCATRIGLPIERRWLRRRRATRPQVGLHAAARHENVADAFAATPHGTHALAGRRVLLVDDVTTSGATLEAAAGAMRRAGAASVWGLALAQPSLQADGGR
jgi:ComF family protein